MQQEETLRVTDASGSIVFSTGGKWLHPLFALEDFLAANKQDTAQLALEDKIIGFGAAVLVIRMGFKSCHARLLSGKAVPLLEKFGVSFTWDQKVDAIECRTETLFTLDTPIEEAYAELSRRAGRQPHQRKPE